MVGDQSIISRQHSMSSPLSRVAMLSVLWRNVSGVARLPATTWFTAYTDIDRKVGLEGRIISFTASLRYQELNVGLRHAQNLCKRIGTKRGQHSVDNVLTCFSDVAVSRIIRPPAQGQCHQSCFHLDKPNLGQHLLQSERRSGVFIWLDTLHITLGPHLQGMIRCQCPIVRLGVEVYLDHLTPASRTQNPEYVGQVIDPSISMDAARHQPTVYQVKVVRGEC